MDEVKRALKAGSQWRLLLKLATEIAQELTVSWRYP
jgi:hypothetical protein